ncbi:putative nuclease HARBI1 [Solea solea]|uniref:putative nuclease HARBI1 n=1 Tax=Solea solea TaxID=90069 RepID=UPI00272CB1E9|nr:putative nuclease HARBI1 [Solea solea]
MAFALPVWLVVQEELLQNGADDCRTPSCFDEYDDETLFQVFHLTRTCITFITDSIRRRMKTVTVENVDLSVDAMVMVALNYYAQGVSSPVVLDRVGLTTTESASYIVATVSGIIVGMSDQFILFPRTRDARGKVAYQFERLGGIPHVVGILAPAHFKIRASPYEKSSFRSFVNSQGYTSVVSQIICDSEGNILSVDKCCVGSTFEQEMWESSSQGKDIEKQFNWLVGGKGYHLSSHILTPLSDPVSDGEIRFNVAHEKILDIMRTTLGSMKRRFRCLMQLGFAQEATLHRKCNIIKACSVLHNIAKKFSVPPPPAAGKIEPLHPGKQHSVPVEICPEAVKARQKIIDEVFSSGSSSQEPPGDNITEEE